MTKAYVIGNITITNPDGYDQYIARVPVVVAAFGGHYRVRGGMATTLDGQASDARHVVIEFPSREQAQAQAWYDSVDYQSILPLRLSNSTGHVALVDAMSIYMSSVTIVSGSTGAAAGAVAVFLLFGAVIGEMSCVAHSLID